MQLAPLQKLSVIAGGAFLLLGLVTSVSYYYSSRLVESDRAVERTNQNLRSAFGVVVAWQDGERAVKAYVVRNDSLSRNALREAQSRVEDALDVIAKGTEDSPHQRRLLRELAQRVADGFEVFRAAALVRDRAGADSARRLLTSSAAVAESDTLVKIVGHMRDEELRVLAEQTRLQGARGVSAQRIILAVMVLTFLLAGVALQPMRETVAQRLTSRLMRDQMPAGPELTADASNREVARAAQLRALHRLSAALSSVQNAGEAALSLIDAAAPHLGASLAALIQPDGTGGLEIIASTDDAFDRVEAGLARPIADALTSGETGLVESRAARDGSWGELPSLDASNGRGAVLIVPLSRSGTASGVLLAARSDDHVFGDDELLFAATLGRLGGLAIPLRPLTS